MKIEAELKSGYRLTFLTSWDYDEGQTEIGDVIAETIEDLIRLGAKFIDNHCIDLYDEDLKRCMIEECQWIEYKELFGESKFMSDGAYGNYINKEEIFKKIIASSKYLKEKKRRQRSIVNSVKNNRR